MTERPAPSSVAPATQDALRSLVVGVYLPVLAVQTAVAMLVPTLPLWLRELDLGYTEVSIVLAAAGLGGLVGNVPVGRALEHRDPDRVMAIAVVVAAAAIGSLALVESTPLLFAAQVAAGAGASGLLLSRQADVLERVPPAVRGRAMSGVGGTLRVSLLIGPAVGGALADAVGFTTTFLVAGVVASTGLVPVAVGRRRRLRLPPRPDAPPPVGRRPVRLLDHWRALAGAGSAQVASMAIRFGRQVLFPLWGAAVGLDAAQIGLVVSLSGLLDLLLFPVAGVLMDRYGRLWAIVPAFSLMSLGMALLPVIGGVAGLLVAGVLVGIGNGIGAGTMLTVGTDLAPQEGAGRFLAALAVIRDSGRIVGPLVVGVAADAVGLGWSAAVLAVAGAGTVGLFVVVVGETRPDRT